MSSLESAGEEFSAVHEGTSEQPRAREGLPSSYRMRADSHYVDLLTSRTISGRERAMSSIDMDTAPATEATAAAPAPSATASPAARVATVALPARVLSPASLDDVALGADDDLEKALASLTACTELLSGADSELARVVTGTLLRAEMWRASCLLKATRVLRGSVPILRTTLAVGKLIDQVLNGFLPERRLRAIDFVLKSSLPPDCVIVTDERLLSVALCSAARASISLFRDAPATLTLAVSVTADDRMTFAFSQNVVTVPDAWFAQAFDAEWTSSRPGGQTALVSMLAVHQAAEALGGHARVAAVGRGTSISIGIPWGVL